MSIRRLKHILGVALFLGSVAVVVSITVPPSSSLAEYGDIIMNREAEQAEMAPVVFPHWFHRIRYKCKVCHPDIFLMKAGANEVSMIKIIKGEFCGKCHNGRIAWAPLYCDRCHSGKSQFESPEVPSFGAP